MSRRVVILFITSFAVSSCSSADWESDPEHSIVSLASNDVWDERTFLDVADRGVLAWQNGCAVLNAEGLTLLPVFAEGARAVRMSDSTGVQFDDGAVIETGDVRFAPLQDVVSLDRPRYPSSDPDGCLTKVNYDGIKYVLVGVSSRAASEGEISSG